MKLRILLFLLLLPAIALTIYTYKTADILTEYPSCGGGYFTAPTGAGVYNLPCIAADGRPTKQVRQYGTVYVSLGLLAGLILANGAAYIKMRKVKN